MASMKRLTQKGPPEEPTGLDVVHLFAAQINWRESQPIGQSKTLIAHEWQQSHESSSLDRAGHGVLADRGAAGLAATDNFPVAVH